MNTQKPSTDVCKGPEVSKNSSLSASNSFIPPAQVQLYLKALERKTSGKGRKRARSLILTKTSNKEEIERACQNGKEAQIIHCKKR